MIKTKHIIDPTNINNAAKVSSVQQTVLDGHGQDDTMPVLLEEGTKKFKDISKQVDVGDLNQDLMISKGGYQGQRHSRFSNKKGSSRVIANAWRMRMLDESSSAKPTVVKTNSLSMSMDNLDMNGFQSTSSGGGTYSKSSKSKSSKSRSKCSKKKTIECENGFTTSVGGKTVQNTTCTEACKGKCCDDGEGGDPCSGLSADICMDGHTCSGGKEACVDTTATSIFKGCSNGDFACKFAGGEGGNLGKIIRSCNNGDLACAFAAQNGGTINGGIIDSCNAYFACRGVAFNNGGLINGTIEGSCNNVRACDRAGSALKGRPSRSISTGLYSCCNGANECYQASDTTHQLSVMLVSSVCFRETCHDYVKIV